VPERRSPCSARGDISGHSDACAASVIRAARQGRRTSHGTLNHVATAITQSDNNISGFLSSKEDRSVPDIACVICTRNRPNTIGQAVTSVLANTHPDFELIVVDQSTNTQTAEILSTHQADPRLKYVHVDRAGLSAAYNLGISKTSAQIIAFTDDDCLAPADWLTSIERVFERHSEVAMLYGQTLIAPELTDTEGTVPHFVIKKEVLLGGEGRKFRVAGMGSNFAIRRELMGKVGGFDEILGGGGPLKSSQDFDFLYRAWRAGAITLLSPEVSVDHYGLRKGHEWVDTQNAYGVGDGAFYMKHVRCGDWYALSLLVRKLIVLIIREVVNPIRRKPSKSPYLISCFKGICMSLRYKVDRSRRLYA
jgi:glycosyltransferase involved in cell wall biosynthesis